MNSLCPERRDLSAFLLGALPDLSREALEEHVLSCQDCQETLGSLDLGADTLLAGLAGAAQQSRLDVAPALAVALEAIASFRWNELPGDATGAFVPADESAREGSTDSEAARPTPANLSGNSKTLAPPLPARFGRYEVVAWLGEGAFGSVYRGRDPQLERDVAIKTPRADRASHPEVVERYLEEARVAARLDHPGLVPVYDCGRSDDGRPFVASKYVAGKNLKQAMQAGRMSPAEAAALVADVAEALHHAHAAGVVHRDVKPANILLDEAGRPLLADFGLALRAESFSLDATRCGTVHYMSPEQADGRAHAVDGRSDIYSLGVVLYELLTGRVPYRSRGAESILAEISNPAVEVLPPRQIDASLPAELERVCLKALAKRPSERYTTALDMANELRRLVAGGKAEVAVQPATAARGVRRAVMAGLAAFAIVGVAGWAVFRDRGDAQPSRAASTAESAAPAPLRIEMVEYHQLASTMIEGEEVHEPAGAVLETAYVVREGDALRLSARLSRPAYCFWLAGLPNGNVDLCFPTDPDSPPPPTDRPTHPVDWSDEETAFTLTDGAGLLAFALIVSEKPLPSYNEWRKGLGEIPWRATTAQDVKNAAQVWRHDGQSERAFSFAPGNVRGAVGKIAERKSVLSLLVEKLQSDSHVNAVDAWLFPIRPRLQASD